MRGIDIDPERIREAIANAVRARVTDKVRFIEGDLFKENIGGATVVTLYLLTELNLKAMGKTGRLLLPRETAEIAAVLIIKDPPASIACVYLCSALSRLL